METLISLSEGNWIKKDKVYPTKEEQEILSSNSTSVETSGTTIIKKEILDSIELKNKPNILDVQKSTEFYNTNKPVLNDGDIYYFIASSVSIDGDNISGFINYSLNGVINKINK